VKSAQVQKSYAGNSSGRDYTCSCVVVLGEIAIPGSHANSAPFNCFARCTAGGKIAVSSVGICLPCTLQKSRASKYRKKRNG
jgi:hypothetical protein